MLKLGVGLHDCVRVDHQCVDDLTQHYQRTHAEIEKAIGSTPADGMIFHVARATDQGFEMIDVWESKEHFDKFGEEVVGPAMARAGIDTSGPQPTMTEFEPVGLMTATGWPVAQFIRAARRPGSL